MGARLGKRQVLLGPLPPLGTQTSGGRMRSASMTSAIYWFRNDLRLHDNPALAQACAQHATLLPVYCMGSANAIHNGDLH